MKFHTFTFYSLHWICEEFYKNGKKTVPYNIENFLSPLALAIWIMMDG
jgi:hypothetical protein